MGLIYLVLAIISICLIWDGSTNYNNGSLLLGIVGLVISLILSITMK